MSFNKWGNFFAVIIESPGFVIPSILTIILLFLSNYYRENVSFSNTMAIIGSIFASIAGAFFKDELDKLSNKNILEKKGLSAMRNIKGIQDQLNSIKIWINKFIKDNNGHAKQNLEEINRHIGTIELSVASGLSDWIDIVPSVKKEIEQEVEIDKKYKEIARSAIIELLEKRKELVTTKNKEDEEGLKKKINNLEKQIKDIKRERPHVLSGGFGLVDNDSDLTSDYFSTQRLCDNCHKPFIPININGNSSLMNYCDKCRKKIFGL
jgi:hypothetical protein